MRIGITGGIGSGKSIVCKLFSLLKIPVYDADAAARRLMEEDPEIQSKLQELFDFDVLDSKGKLNRNMIARKVFENADLLSRLNAIVHPAVILDSQQWENKNTAAPYTIRESAILFESGTDKGLDQIILVDAPEEIRIKRVMDRDHRKEEEIKAIISRQWTSEKKKNLSHACIINDDKHLVIPQVLSIHEKLIQHSV